MSSQNVVEACGFTVRTLYCCDVCGLEVGDRDVIVKHLAADHHDTGLEFADYSVSLDLDVAGHQQNDVTSSTVLSAKHLRRKSHVSVEQTDSQSAALKKPKPRFTKPLVCPKCGQAYKYMGCFKRHVKREHSKSASSITDGEAVTAFQLASDVINLSDGELEQDSNADSLLNNVHQLELKEVTYKLDEVLTGGASDNKQPADEALKSLQTAPYCCPECPKQLRTRCAFQIHMTDKHTGWTYVCKWCGRLFTAGHRLHSHMILDHGKVPRCDPVDLSEVVLGSRRCMICRCRYRGEEEFAKHVASHDDSLPAFACTMCSGRYFTKSGLRCHTRRIHAGE